MPKRLPIGRRFIVQGLAWMVLGIYVMLTGLNLPGMVICYHPEDGYLAMETSIGGHCSDSWNTLDKHQTGKTLGLSAASQNACVDTPVSLESLHSKGFHWVSMQGMSSVAFQASEPVLAFSKNRDLVLWAKPPPELSSIHHRLLGTTFLLI